MTPKEEQNQGVDKECGGVETLPVSVAIRPPEEEQTTSLDLDADGDQILPAEDEKDTFRKKKTTQHVDIEMAVKSGKDDDTDKSRFKYPGIPEANSFDTAETESSFDGSSASTDDGEISRPTNEEDGEEGNQRRCNKYVELILERLQAARNKMWDMINWYTFVALSFLTAVAAILCVAFGNHGVAAILLFVAVFLITVLICWLRLDLRAIEMM